MRDLNSFPPPLENWSNQSLTCVLFVPRLSASEVCFLEDSAALLRHGVATVFLAATVFQVVGGGAGGGCMFSSTRVRQTLRQTDGFS